MMSTVRAKLGKWLEIGGVANSASFADSTLSGARAWTSRMSAAFYLKLDIVR